MGTKTEETVEVLGTALWRGIRSAMLAETLPQQRKSSRRAKETGHASINMTVCSLHAVV